ncbi:MULTISPECIES: alpha/beta fold hydrolase [Pectobacterium]|uniref:alpha/beta fold hydrolase n=1 Tax=Pectobacterium TaxID=122277 RepID=UPI0015DE505F|nr:alpha/beta fold hydrolase [Pectobacterium sp. CFBP8739]MBA0166552.1 alpha/beta hydrolase [Pectobacterium sp. CFBP8739]
MSKNFLLIHGAWQGAWVWNTVQPKLKVDGNTVKAIDLPGSGEDQTPVTAVSLDAYARKIIDAARALSVQGKVTLVGHSMGGAAITLAASLAPDLFEKLIYVCAMLPQNGESVAMLAEQSKKLGTEGPIVQPLLDKGVLVLVPEKIASTFFNDDAENDTDSLLAQFKPQPIQPLTETVTWTEGFINLPKAYIVCTQDLAISPKLQQKMAEKANVGTIYTLDAGHEPFFSQDEKLSEILLTV